MVGKTNDLDRRRGQVVENGAQGAAGTPERRAAVEVEGLVKRFGTTEAVRGVDLTVFAGETFGFLGPNGAGKSTTINMLCTLLRPSAGRALVAGFDVVTERDDVRREIGLVFQDTTLDTYLSAAQNLRFHAQLYGVPSDELESRMRQVLELVGLWDRRDKDVSTYSGGMKRRLEIARGLLHSPRVLFLDEPTVGLDPQTRASIWAYLEELRRQEDLTIFLTTHYMDEAEHCDRIAIMDAGRVVALDTPQALKASIGTDRIRLVTADDTAAAAAIAGRFGLEVADKGDGLVLQVADGEAFVPRLLADIGVPVSSVSVTRPTLDDVFLTYTGRTIRDAENAGPEIPAMFRRTR
jgi:ABC-2 type transport system ATP-binding protein